MATTTDEVDYKVAAKQPREVTLTLQLSAEALRRVLDKEPKHPTTPEGGILNELIIAFMSICEKLRNAQGEFLDKNNGKIPLNAPDLNRYDDLRDAGRLAQLAITNAETALMYALRAAERVR